MPSAVTSNKKSTILGIIALVGALCSAAIAVFDGDPTTQIDTVNLFTLGAVAFSGLGNIFSN